MDHAQSYEWLKRFKISCFEAASRANCTKAVRPANRQHVDQCASSFITHRAGVFAFHENYCRSLYPLLSRASPLRLSVCLKMKMETEGKGIDMAHGKAHSKVIAGRVEAVD